MRVRLDMPFSLVVLEIFVVISSKKYIILFSCKQKNYPNPPGKKFDGDMDPQVLETIALTSFPPYSSLLRNCPKMQKL